MSAAERLASDAVIAFEPVTLDDLPMLADSEAVEQTEPAMIPAQELAR